MEDNLMRWLGWAFACLMMLSALGSFITRYVSLNAAQAAAEGIVFTNDVVKVDGNFGVPDGVSNLNWPHSEQGDSVRNYSSIQLGNSVKGICTGKDLIAFLMIVSKKRGGGEPRQEVENYENGESNLLQPPVYVNGEIKTAIDLRAISKEELYSYTYTFNAMGLLSRIEFSVMP